MSRAASKAVGERHEEIVIGGPDGEEIARSRGTSPQQKLAAIDGGEIDA